MIERERGRRGGVRPRLRRTGSGREADGTDGSCYRSTCIGPDRPRCSTLMIQQNWVLSMRPFFGKVPRMTCATGSIPQRCSRSGIRCGCRPQCTKLGMSGFERNESMSLSRLQRRVSTLVFALSEADGFALAGGGALIAHEVVDRTTRDLDCFGPSLDAVDRFWPAIRTALISDGLEVDVRQTSHGFAKMTVIDPTTGETTQVDVGFDPARRPTISTSIGPVRALEDLAGDKLLALFGRAAPRDFVDPMDRWRLRSELEPVQLLPYVVDVDGRTAHRG